MDGSTERAWAVLGSSINARVWAGIHFRTGDVQGAVLGKKVARYLHKPYFQRSTHRSWLRASAGA